MTAFFSQDFLDALLAGGTGSMTGVTLGMYVFPNAPLFEAQDERYIDITTPSALANLPGWGPYVAQLAPAVAVTLNTPATGVHYLTTPNGLNLPDDFPASKVGALAFVYQTGPDAAMVGKLMFVTNSIYMDSDESLILYNQDGIIAAPDPINIPSGPNRWLMSWIVPTAGVINYSEGEIVVQKGIPPFEPARTQHVWMYPQRVNMIANPSFEAGTTHWKHSGAVSQVSGGVDSAHYGHFTGTSPIILESNTFPVMVRKTLDDGWTIHITARGDGELKIGLLTWPSDYSQTVVDWGPLQEVGRWVLGATSWLTFRTLRKVFDVSYGALRLETDGTFLDIDHICAEPGWMPANNEDWPYFDGDSRYGALDDFSWYGDKDRPTGTASREHTTYSCWYNHRRSIMGRLFQLADPDDTGPGSVFTDEEVAAQGLVYRWVPAGTPVLQHLDVLYPNDPQSAVPDVTGPVTPRPVDANDLMGVPDPWA